ncbi:hypothetical protein [Lutibacter sp.]|uniref:hypothetical protein n=1 Tax=Lutibacter sp. TaxID=1925666 RepID=UPI0025BCE521|nr:hypothetical protein [Lutibacter sp.]
MKKIILLVFFVLSIVSYSQEKASSEINTSNSTDSKRIRKGTTIGKWTDISQDSKRIGRGADVGDYATVRLSSGISTPSASFKDKAYAESGNFFELSGAYYFSKFGFGAAIGQYTNSTDANLERLTNSLSFATTNATEDWKVTYYGFGPEYTTSFNKIQASLFLRTGILSIKPISLQSNYTENTDVAFPIYEASTTETSNISYVSTAIKLGYNFSNNFSVFATIDFMSALSNDFTITEKKITDTNRNGTIDLEDFLKLDAASITFDEIKTTIKPQTTNFGIGLSYTFSSKKDGVGGQTHGQHNRGRAPGSISPASTPSQNTGLLDFQKPDKVEEQTSRMNKGELTDVIDKGNGTKAQDHNGSRSNTTSSKVDPNSNGNNNSDATVKRKKPGRTTYSNITLERGSLLVGENRVSITLTNPSKEKAEQKDKQLKLINILPKNNSNFKNINEIGAFTWKLIGVKTPKPNYIIEVTKISKAQQPQRSYTSKTSKNTINASSIFKDGKLSDGNYRWKVTETTTRISSNPSYFTMSSCEIDFTIANEEIECLGYEQENRKFKICFDVTYSSTSGDLTYLDPSSGLTVYDQTYATLSHTLVSPNLTLVSQVGATTSTVSYCFEVTVSASVTSIGFGLQGDDLDPSPITCQPGVSQLFDELPSCICDDCEEIELSFDDFNITPNEGTGNQFNFNGNINVNVPVYGIEFQIQSYTYSAAPSACTEGVSSIEESGMILMPGTSINGSTTLQLFNETASGSASSNDNATKDIKYTSNSPLTGPIPINLNIGLPGPISGLDPSCCVIDYTVCIKVKVFYEESNCKSCVFTHCFEFNNQ